jgi:hypothetical protein
MERPQKIHYHFSLQTWEGSGRQKGEGLNGKTLIFESYRFYLRRQFEKAE